MTTRRHLIALLAAGAFAPFLARAQADPKNKLGLEVDFVPSPAEVVDAMLKLADVKKTDLVYDLGCGDGRIVIEAAKRFGARGVGIDIDPDRIAEARENARKAGVEKLVTFRQEDLFKANFSNSIAYRQENLKLLGC